MKTKKNNENENKLQTRKAVVDPRHLKVEVAE